MTLSLKATNEYIPSLDGFRAVSIVFVLIAHILLHLNINIIPGGFGVTVFFFISGFLITRLIFSEIHLKQDFSIKRFYFRRFLRLYPPLILLVALTSVYVLFQGKSVHIEGVLPAFFYYMNYYLLSGGGLSLPIGSLWSLAVEEHFYLVYPWLIKLFKNNIKGLFCFSISVVVIVLCWRFFLMSHFHFVGGHYTYQATDTRIDSILYGCLLSLFLEFEVAKVVIDKISSWYVFILAVVLLLLCFLIREDSFRETVRYSIQGVSLWIIFASLLFTEKYNFLKRILEHKALVYLGKISYSLYLWHGFTIGIVLTLFGAENKIVFVLMSVFFSVFVASLSYYCLEKPFMKLRHKLR